MDNGLGSILSEPTEEATEPVEQAEPEVVESEDTGETTAPPAEQQEEDPVEKHRKGLEAAVLAERRKRQELEHQLKQLQQPKEPPKQQEGIARPRRDEYQSQEAYEDALLEYGDRRREVRMQQERAQQEEREHIANFERAAADTIAKGQAKYADFDAVINGGLAPYLNPTMQEALVVGGGYEVAYWLAKNPAEAQRVSQLPPMAMVLEIGRLEAKARATEPRPSIPRTLTQERDSRTGQFRQAAYEGPTPLDDIFKR